MCLIASIELAAFDDIGGNRCASRDNRFQLHSSKTLHPVASHPSPMDLNNREVRSGCLGPICGQRRCLKLHLSWIGRHVHFFNVSGASTSMIVIAGWHKQGSRSRMDAPRSLEAGPTLANSGTHTRLICADGPEPVYREQLVRRPRQRWPLFLKSGDTASHICAVHLTD